MNATATATEFAADLGDRIKHEAQKLHALEAVTRPLRKPEPKKKSKLGMLMVLIIGASTAYALYRKLRGTNDDTSTGTNHSTNGTTPAAARDDSQRLVTSGL